jgi:hypothetical protein
VAWRDQWETAILESATHLQDSLLEGILGRLWRPCLDFIMVNQDLRDWSRQGGRKNRGSGSAVCWVGIAGALFCEGSCARQVVANWEDELEIRTGVMQHGLTFSISQRVSSVKKFLDFAKQICLRSSNWREKHSQRIVATDLVNMPCK